MRDEFAVLRDLGLDPFEVAGLLAKRSPVLGEAVQAEGSGAFAGTVPDPVHRGISGERPRRFEAECGMVAEMFDRPPAVSAVCRCGVKYSAT